MSNKQASPITSLIVAILFMAGGWTLHSNLTKALVDKAEATNEWPSVQGVITFSEITESTSDGKQMYSPLLQYNYKVAEAEYNGSKLNFVDGSTSSRSSVESELSNFQPGAIVPVFYDPENPSSSVLVTGGGLFIKILKYGPWLVMCVGVLIIFSTIKRIFLSIFR